jgi:capsular polysaccharide biosynthesis protein
MRSWRLCHQGKEQISPDIAKKTQLSGVRAVQRAEKSIVPVFPRVTHSVVLALAGGIALGSAIALTLELTRGRRRDEDEEGVRSKIDEVVRLSARNHLKQVQAAE